MLNKTGELSGKVARLNLQLQLVALRLRLLPPPYHLLSGKVARLNLCRKDELTEERRLDQGVPVDPTLLPDTDEHGESRAIILRILMIGRTSTPAELSDSSVPIVRELSDSPYASSMSGGGMRPNMP